MNDKVAENHILLLLDPCGQYQTALSPQHVETDPDQEKERELQENYKAAGNERNSGLPQRSTAQIALDHHLIGPVTGHGEKSAADESRPEGEIAGQVGAER